MVPRTTRRLTERTATNPANSLVRSSVSRTISLRTTFPHAGHCRRVPGGRKGKLRRRDSLPAAVGRAGSLCTTTKIRTRPGGRPGGSKRSAPASGEKRADGDFKICHHTLVATTPGKVQWRTRISHLALDYFDGIRIPECGRIIDRHQQSRQ